MSVYIRIKNLLATTLDNENGASIVEYALLVSLIAVVAMVAVATFGGALSTEYSEIAASIP
jgi:Flp pilus assembly pilin Flp